MNVRRVIKDSPQTIYQEEMFSLGTDHGGPFIICKWCSYKSHSANDIKFKYCGNCSRFLIELKVERRKKTKVDDIPLFDISQIPRKQD